MEKENLNTIPIVEEKLTVSKIKEASAEVTINKTVETFDESVDVTLENERVSVERVKIGKVIDSHPDIKTVGDKTIIPVVREELVVTKRLILEEEIHVTKVISQEVKKITETLRKNVINVEKTKI